MAGKLAKEQRGFSLVVNGSEDVSRRGIRRYDEGKTNDNARPLQTSSIEGHGGMKQGCQTSKASKTILERE